MNNPDLIIFDIDGTIVDSVKVDDDCFIQTFRDLHNIDLSNANWNDFEHVTDSGITTEVFQRELNRTPTTHEIGRIKNHFSQLVKERSHEFMEVKGAIDTLNYLVKQADYAIAFATGGWKETATLKLNRVGFEPNDVGMITSDDHFSRREITRLAIAMSLNRLNIRRFESITYVGDGIWDYRTALDLDISFIGVDYQQNGKLIKAGASKVIKDFTGFMESII